MSWFERVNFYYETGLWDIKRVWDVVGKVITEEEYQQITDFEYPNMPQ